MMQMRAASPLTLTSVEIRSAIGDGLLSSKPRDKTSLNDPNKALQDLTLPSKTLEVLTSPLQALAFQLMQDEVKDPDDLPYKISIARGGDLTLFFIHIPSWILDDPGNGNVQAVGALFYLFKIGTRLYVYSEGASDYAYAYENVFKRWNESGLTVMFVPWRRVSELSGKNMEVQKTRVISILGLDLKPASTINDRDMKQLVSMLTVQAAAYKGTPENYFRDLVMKSSLPGNWTQEVLNSFSGVPEAVARNLVLWLLAKGENPQMPRYKALASMLQAMIESVGVGERKIIMSIIQEYQLIGDAAEIESLRKRCQT